MSRFFINTDPDGNMPVLSWNKPVKEHFVEYVNDHPVRGHLAPGTVRIYDYAKQEFYALKPGVKNYKGTDLPVIPFTEV